MKDIVEVYKRVGKEEFVIHTILDPKGTSAVIKWYSRSRPFHGSTKIDIMKEGSQERVSLVKGHYKASDLWNMKKRKFIKEIDDFIKENRKEVPAEKKVEDKGDEPIKKGIVVKDVKD